VKTGLPSTLPGSCTRKCTYLDAFCRPEHFGLYLPDYPNLDELKAHYQRGGLVPHHSLSSASHRWQVYLSQTLYDGCESVPVFPACTLDDVRKAMKINYFDDAELIAEQVKKFSAE